MEKGVWLDYDPSTMSLKNNDTVLIRRKGYGCIIELCIYNDMYKCFDGADGDDYFCELDSVDKIFIVPDVV